MDKAGTFHHPTISISRCTSRRSISCHPLKLQYMICTTGTSHSQVISRVECISPLCNSYLRLLRHQIWCMLGTKHIYLPLKAAINHYIFLARTLFHQPMVQYTDRITCKYHLTSIFVAQNTYSKYIACHHHWRGCSPCSRSRYRHLVAFVDLCSCRAHIAFHRPMPSRRGHNTRKCRLLGAFRRLYTRQAGILFCHSRPGCKRRIFDRCHPLKVGAEVSNHWVHIFDRFLELVYNQDTEGIWRRW